MCKVQREFEFEGVSQKEAGVNLKIRYQSSEKINEEIFTYFYRAVRLINMPVTPCIDNTQTQYESSEHLNQLILNGHQKHMEMIDTQLLNFDMKWADFEINDPSHDGTWRRMSIQIFKNIGKVHDNNVSAWSEKQAENLLFILRTTLRVVLPMIKLSSSDHKKKAYNILPLRKLLKL